MLQSVGARFDSTRSRYRVAHLDNRLIELLPRAARRSLLAICEPVELVMSEVLSEQGKPTRYVYFPTDSFVSLVTIVEDKPFLEVGMVGYEGMHGVQLALGVDAAPLHSFVQGAGAAKRIKAAKFRRELGRSAPLRRVLQLYAHVLMTQLATSAGCVRFHWIGPRMARWLLMTQDRARSEQFHVTHEFLSYMLGVRRVGITTAASTLQRAGLIKYRRGELTVLDRAGLEAAACPCYADDRRAYEALLH